MIDALTYKIVTEAAETEDEFIFTTIKSWCEYKIQRKISKHDLEKALALYFNQKTEWIPVSERLPEVGHRVLFNMKNDEIYIGTLYTSRHNDGFKITLEPTGIAYVYALENVKAWMPLPEPYKAESEG